jgi:hypothetical protein
MTEPSDKDARRRRRTERLRRAMDADIAGLRKMIAGPPLCTSSLTWRTSNEPT